MISWSASSFDDRSGATPPSSPTAVDRPRCLTSARSAWNVSTPQLIASWLRTSGFGRLAAEGRLDTFLDLVEKLDGLPRHVALHPCGVLLSDASLLDRTPVERSAAGFPMSHFDKDDVEDLFEVLQKRDIREPANWSRRFKNHQEKLKSGDVYQVAEVVRNLALRDQAKGLSAGEKRMLSKARQILVSELALAEHTNEDKAEAILDEVLQS